MAHYDFLERRNSIRKFFRKNAILISILVSLIFVIVILISLLSIRENKSHTDSVAEINFMERTNPDKDGAKQLSNKEIIDLMTKKGIDNEGAKQLAPEELRELLSK